MKTPIYITPNQLMGAFRDMVEHADQHQMLWIVGQIFDSYDFHAVDPVALLQKAARIATRRHNMRLRISQK